MLGYDGTDADALQRRLKAREEHLAGAKRMKEEGTMLYGGALLDDDGKMIGSMVVVDYPTREAVQTEWLDNEPYVTGKVWERIEITPCKIPDFFL